MAVTIKEIKMITVIIPSIGRATLMRSVESLQKQSNPKWLASVGFDGIPIQTAAQLVTNDSRISYAFLPSKIGGGQNCGGAVRKHLMNLCTTEWVCFLDDDDTFRNLYIENFYEELTKNPNADCIVFRMSQDKNDLYVLPPLGLSMPVAGQTGISFAVRLSFLQKNNLSFTNNPLEGFFLLEGIYNKNGKIIFSNYIGYNVGY